MRPKSPKLLEDIKLAAEFITLHTDRLSPEAYEENELIRSAVERKFLIIGEALWRLQLSDPTVLDGISEHRKIIGFRHRMAHGYDQDIDNALVWEIIKVHLPILHAEVTHLLASIE